MNDRQRLSRRSFLGLSATAALGAVLAGCASPGAQGPATPQPAGQATAKPAPQEKIVLTHPCKWLGEGDSRYPAASKILALYKERRPDVEVELIPNPKKEETLKKIQADCAANDCPDIFERADFDLWESGWLLDLAPHIDAEWKSRLLPQALELTTWQGHTWGIGTETSPIPCMWNLKALNEVGAKVPATWQEFLEVGEKLKSKGKFLSTFTLGFNDHFPNNVCFRRPGAAEIMGKEQWDNEHSLYTLERMKELHDGKVHPPNDLDITWREAVPLLQNGQMAMLMNGAWALGSQIAADGVDPELRNNVAFSAIPATGPEGTSIEYKYAGVLGLGHHLAKQEKKLEAALDWARVWSSVEAALIWAVDGEAGMGVNVPKDQWDKALEQRPLFKKFMDSVSDAKVVYSLGSPSRKVRMRSWLMWTKSAQALLLGKSTKDAMAEFVKWMQEA